jgi:hypothetical protein
MRFRIGDIYQLGESHYLVLGLINLDFESSNRYLTLNLEKGIVSRPLAWYADQSGVFVT